MYMLNVDYQSILLYSDILIYIYIYIFISIYIRGSTISYIKKEVRSTRPDFLDNIIHRK